MHLMPTIEKCTCKLLVINTRGLHHHGQWKCFVAQLVLPDHEFRKALLAVFERVGLLALAALEFTGVTISRHKLILCTVNANRLTHDFFFHS